MSGFGGLSVGAELYVIWVTLVLFILLFVAHMLRH